MKIGEQERKDIAIEYLKEAPYNEKDRIEDDGLVRSIAAAGVLQPLLVIEPDENGIHEIVCGNRRWKAAKAAGISTLPCTVISRDTPMDEREEKNLMENVHRKGLSFPQRYKRMMKVLKFYNQNVELTGAKTGFGTKVVEDYITYGKLEERIKNEIRTEQDFNNAVEGYELPEDALAELLHFARSHYIGRRAVSKVVREMKEDPTLTPDEAFKETQDKGTKVSIQLDGRWHDSMLNTMKKLKVGTKQGFVEECVKNRIRDEGFAPK
jgi:ParB family chromosome partitioning protein